MSPLEFLDARSSVRAFDPNAKISTEEIKNILSHAANAPSSNNFQPWKVIVIKNKAKQKILKNFSADQKQVEDSSAVFLIFGDKSTYDVQKIMNFNIRNKIIRQDELREKTERVTAYLQLHPEDAENEGLRFDIGLFSMNLMYVVRAFGYESVPMRGVFFDKIMDYLNIPKTYEPILMLPVGKALQPGFPHLRYPIDEFSNIIE
ncbi:nitroreductase family protein [Lactococcus allomyrinae]|uniref:Nitroreductase family protein n=1 Tax=Lactococcus allomyrinae TaxID=2419773 RepID=A0A387BAI5_9LACT|nr:nitroreductase family protein [Lactococcus allomyrinae]AYG00753.1 nitroreductase family protein [Lactococcus allomyrinae]